MPASIFGICIHNTRCSAPIGVFLNAISCCLLTRASYSLPESRQPAKEGHEGQKGHSEHKQHNLFDNAHRAYVGDSDSLSPQQVVWHIR
jgi:hypothetical protein